LWIEKHGISSDSENKYRPPTEENKIPFLYRRNCDLILKPFTMGILTYK
jgi:hypothetical protein